MEIRIKDDGDEITLSDDHLNNNAFVDIYINDSEGVTIPLIELKAAVDAFYNQQVMFEERDKRLT